MRTSTTTSRKIEKRVGGIILELTKQIEQLNLLSDMAEKARKIEAANTDDRDSAKARDRYFSMRDDLENAFVAVYNAKTELKKIINSKFKVNHEKSNKTNSLYPVFCGGCILYKPFASANHAFLKQ